MRVMVIPFLLTSQPRFEVPPPGDGTWTVVRGVSLFTDVEPGRLLDAADAMFTKGNRMGPEGDQWPSDVRSLSVGDLVLVVPLDPPAGAVWLNVDRFGFSRRANPTIIDDRRQEVPA